MSTLRTESSITRGARDLDDLIYGFLLKSGYPRASLVFNIDLLAPNAHAKSGIKAPTFVIVDPDSADPLAVMEIVDSVDLDSLKHAAIETGAYASRLAGNFIQGFVIRVDVAGETDEEKVQFFRIWPNSTLQQLSSKNFPDLDSLRVSRKIAINTTANMVQQDSVMNGSQAVFDDEVFDGLNEVHGKSTSSNAGLYLPAILLLILVLADFIFTAFIGQSFLSVSRSILMIGAAALLTLPAAIRYLRQ